MLPLIQNFIVFLITLAICTPGFSQPDIPLPQTNLQEDNRTRRVERQEKRRQRREQRQKRREGEENIPSAVSPRAVPNLMAELPRGGVAAAEALAIAETVLQEYESIVLSVTENTAWDLVHALLGYGPQMRVQLANGQVTHALGWLTRGATQGGVAVFEVTDAGIRGRAAHPNEGPFTHGLEGHPNQFFGYLADLDLESELPIYAWDGEQWQERSFRDLIEDAKAHVADNPSPRQPFEKTWTLWGLAHYLDPDEQWVDVYGTNWSLERLLAEELSQGLVREASCYGMHRAYVVAYTLQRWQQKHGVPPEGSVYRQAEIDVYRWIQRARQHQLPDGSFSSDHLFSLRSPTNWKEKITANGHVLEFLLQALPDEELVEPWVSNAVWATAKTLQNMRGQIPGNQGPVFHGLHALRMYVTRRN